MNTPFATCKKSLATMWFAGAGTIFVLILLQTLSGKFAGEEKRAWTWYLPTVMPTLSLIIGVMVADTRHTAADERPVDPFLYRLTMSLSATYFFVVLVPVLAEPLTGMVLLEIMDLSNLWLAPLQGLVAASLGVFFVRRETPHTSDQASRQSSRRSRASHVRP